jgi:hypothetical protein
MSSNSKVLSYLPSKRRKGSIHPQDGTAHISAGRWWKDRDDISQLGQLQQLFKPYWMKSKPWW